MKHASWLLLLLAMSALSATISYYNEGLLRQPNDLQDRIYLRVTNLWPGSNVTFTPVGQGDQYINVGGTITNVSLVTNALWALYASNSIWSQYASNSIWSQYASNSIWALYSSNAISSLSASNWIYSNTLWLILQTNTFATNSLYAGTATNWLGSNSLWVLLSTNLPPICPGSNVWFTTNAGCLTINSTNTGGTMTSGATTNPSILVPGVRTNVFYFTNGLLQAISNYAAPGPVVGATNITNGLVLYWKLNEGTGTNTYDTTSNLLTGVLLGSPIPTWVTNNGFNGASALSFPSLSGSSYDSTTQTNLMNLTNDFSIGMWICHTNPSYGSFEGIARSGADRAYLIRWDSGRYRLYCDGIGGNILEGPNNAWTADPGTGPPWCYLVVTRSNDVFRMFTNGIMSASVTNAGSMLNNSFQTLRVGTDTDAAGRNWRGHIAEVRVHKGYALSDVDIAYLYGTYYGGSAPAGALYVLRAGDTMTGPLNIDSGALTVQDTIYANSNVIVGGNALTISYDSAVNKSAFTVGGWEVLAVNDNDGANGSVVIGKNILGFPVGTPASVGIGLNAGALDNGVAVGNLAIAWTNAVAVGPTTTASDYGIAIGSGINGSAHSIGIGANVAPSVNYAIAIGESAAAGDNGSIAIGTNTVANAGGVGGNAIAIGAGSQATGSNSVAIGASGGSYPDYAGVTAYEAIELGSGIATTAGALHYRGVPICDINGKLIGSFSGNGFGLTNIQLTAITNLWWLTNGYPWTNLLINASNIFWETNIYNMNSASLTNLEEVDSGLFLATGAGFLGNGQYLTNIYSTNLAPNSGVAILASNNVFTGVNTFTNEVLIKQPNANDGLIVSNGLNWVEITNGTVRSSGAMTVGNTLTVSAGNVTVQGSTAAVSATSLYAGQSANFRITASSPAMTITNLAASGTISINAPLSVSLLAPNLYANGATIVSNSVTATNFLTSAVKWIDIPMNYSYSVLGPSAPALTATTNGSVIEELAFDNNDVLYAQAQMQHNVATTNAAFPNWYFEPHVHFTTVGTLDSTHSNVTWQIEWEFAKINGGWTSGTNTVTVGVTNNYIHYMAELGHLTNNSVPHLSSIFRCRLTRPASVGQDYSNAHDVLLDGFDIHIPIGNQNAIGSSIDNAP